MGFAAAFAGDRLRGCADAGHGFSFRIALMLNEPNEYCDSIDITLMKTAKQEHGALIFPDCGGCVTGGFLLWCSWLLMFSTCEPCT